MSRKGAKKVESKPVYKATIKIFGREYKAEGATVSEALGGLKVGGASKGLGIITISKGDVSIDKVLPPRRTFQLFSASKLMREVAIKNVSLLFGGI